MIRTLLPNPANKQVTTELASLQNETPGSTGSVTNGNASDITGDNAAAPSVTSPSKPKKLSWQKRLFRQRKTTTPLQQPISLLIEAMTVTSTQQLSSPLMRQALEQYIFSLNSDDQMAILRTAEGLVTNPHNIEVLLEELRSSYSRKLSTRIQTKSSPLLHHLRSFSTVVDVCVQSKAGVSCLIWGGLKLVLEISTRSAALFDSIFTMLGTLSTYLTLFEDWLRLFPAQEHRHLSDSITKTFLEYISFLVETIKYLRRSAFVNFLRVGVLPSFEALFKKSEENITRLTGTVALQVQTAAHRVASQRYRTIQSMLENPTTGINSADVEPVLPFRYLQNAVKNDRFYGRRLELERVTRILEQSENRVHSVAIYGLGGCGKSQIALEYMYLNLQQYQIAIWLHSDTEEKLDMQFVHIAKELGLVAGNENVNRSRQAVLHWLGRTKARYLLIFDNADDVSFVRPFWPASMQGSIIITSRNPLSVEEGLAATGLKIEPFCIDEGASYLLSFLDQSIKSSLPEVKAATTLSETFAGLPLGLRVAAAFMRSRRCTPSEFIEIWKQHSEEVERSTVPGTQRSLENLWDISLSALTAGATNLLDLLAFVDPDKIPMRLFEQPLSTPGPSGSVTLHFLDAISSLANRSLIDVHYSEISENSEKTECSISLHRYFQSAIFKKVSADTDRLQKACSTVVEYLRLVVPKEHTGIAPQFWPVYEKYAVHVKALASRVRSTQLCLDYPYAGLMCRYGGYYFGSAQYHLGFEAIDIAEKATTVDTLIDTTVKSFIYYNKGRLLAETNQPTESAESFKEAIDLLRDRVTRHPTHSDIDYLSSLYSVQGVALVGAERYEEAETSHREAIRLAQDAMIDSPRLLGTLWANLGSCLLWKGDLAQAETTLHHALLQHERNLECNMYSLGNVYLRQKRFEDALKLHQEVLELFSTKLGHSHHATADSYHKVGSIYALETFEKRDFEESLTWEQKLIFGHAPIRRYLRKALEIYESAWNKGNVMMGPSIARTQWKLARTLRLIPSGNLEEADEMEQRAAKFALERIGVDILDNRDTAEARFDSAVFYWSR